MGNLTQKLGIQHIQWPIFFKRLGGMAMSLSGCMRAIAATALLVENANKITMGQLLEVLSPHQVRAILKLR
jgi:asparagine synthetase A